MTDKALSISLDILGLLRLMRRAFDTRARQFGYTQSQWRVLAHLSRNEGISQAGLAEILDVQPIALARVLDRMEVNGMIERKPDPQDRRALKLFLLPAAQPMLALVTEASNELQNLAMTDLSEGEQETLSRLIGKMRRNVEASIDQYAEKAARPRAAAD